MKKIALVARDSFCGSASVVAEGFSKLGDVDLVINQSTYQQSELSMSFGRVLVGGEFEEFAAESDLIIYSCHAPRAKSNSNKHLFYTEQLELAKRLNRWKRSIFIDGHDSFDYLQEEFLKCQRYFKREKKIGHFYPDNVVGLPYATCDRYFTPKQEKKDILLSCMVRLKPDPKHRVTIRRAPYVSMLKKSFSDWENFYIGTELGGSNHDQRKWSGDREHSNYFEKLAKSVASVSLFGGGFDTLRYWETLASGACLFSQSVEREIEIPNPFVPGEHYVAFKSPRELKKHVKALIKDPEKYQKYQPEALSWAKAHHTAASRAQQILDTI